MKTTIGVFMEPGCCNISLYNNIPCVGISVEATSGDVKEETVADGLKLAYSASNNTEPVEEEPAVDEEGVDAELAELQNAFKALNSSS